MASEICMNCFSVKGQFDVCPYCGYVEGTPPKQPHYLTPGTIIGNHFIVGPVIGVGGFGITYKCFDSTLGVVVAVKEFFPVGLVNRAPGESQVGLLSGDKAVQYREQLKRFLMEARSVAQFGNAKDIVNVFDFFEENGTAYIIMEYIDGVLLKDYMDKMGRIEPEYAMGIIMPIIEAVKKIHSKGIIHQDISPDNIFIMDERTIKIFDFGAARLNDTKEGAGEKVIKVGYSAPEQYRDKNRQGFFTDVYSVGAIMYQLLTGRKPVESTEREHKDRMKSPLELGIPISRNEDRAIMEALAVQPELRYQGIQQFEEALLNKRIAEYPKDKIKKRKRFRNGIIGISVLLAMVVSVGMGLYFLVFKDKQDEFYTDRMKDSKTAITVWVENDVQKEKLEKITNYFAALSEDQDEKVRDMLLGMKDSEVNVVVKEDMDTAIKTASQEGNMPDMFLSDHVSNLQDYELVNLGETVYKQLDTQNYYYLSEQQYQTYYPDMTALPTGLDTLLVYSMGFDYHKDKALEDSVLLEMEEEKGVVELTSLIPPQFDQKPSAEDISKYAYFQTKDDSIANAIVLLKNTESDEDIHYDDEKNAALQQHVRNIIDFGKNVTHKKYRVAKTKDKVKLYGSNVIAGVTYRSTFRDAIDDKIKKSSTNPLNEYEVNVITHNDKMIISYAESFSISSKSSKDEQYLCERLLWLMLNVGQQGKASSQSDTSFPIMKSALQSFKEYNPKLSGFAELIEQNKACILIGSCLLDSNGESKIKVGTPEVRAFTKKIQKIDKEKKISDKAVFDATEEFLNWEDKKGK